MSVIFTAKNHKYESINPEDKTEWVSVTSLVSLFKQEFDPVSQSIKSSRNSRSKWYKMAPETIREIWKNESERANTLGTFYHNQRESDMMGIDTISREGVALPIIKPILEGEKKVAPAQNLVQGIYPEHFVYLKSAGICGQSDRVEVVGQNVDIIDYKTNKEIKLQSYKNYEGISQKMLGPVSHLDDCNFNHYALQLSIYMYIILKHNPQLKPRRMTLHHITFEEEGVNAFGYPVTKLNQEGEPIVKAVIPYEVPYYKREVQDIINWLGNNRNKIKPKK